MWVVVDGQRRITGWNNKKKGPIRRRQHLNGTLWFIKMMEQQKVLVSQFLFFFLLLAFFTASRFISYIIVQLQPDCIGIFSILSYLYNKRRRFTGSCSFFLKKEKIRKKKVEWEWKKMRTWDFLTRKAKGTYYVNETAPFFFCET